jgi:hypothetical protein
MASRSRLFYTATASVAVDDLEAFQAEWKGADHVTARHIKAHREKITEVLERHGWFKASDRMHKAYARVSEAYAALMAAPVTCPDDILAKIEVRGMPVFEETGSEDEMLFSAIYRGVQALAGNGHA